MSKLKQPLLSLEAHGTIADSITLKRTRGKDLATRKPIPAYRRTLPQQYQRWDYQDGISYWNTLTPAQKLVYQSEGAKHHMIGFAYFMRYYLSNLPDIIGRWRMDETIGATAYDSSKNFNHGTIIGASPISGVIDGGFLFDGVNDKVVVPNSPSLNPLSQISIEFFTYPQRVDAILRYMLHKGPLDGTFAGPYCIAYANPVIFEFYISGVFAALTILGVHNAKNHMLFTFESGNGALYLNGTLFATTNIVIALTADANPLKIGLGRQDVAHRYYPGIIDNLTIYNRLLNADDAKRHSERRYP